ncbi:MAG: hypothetical protein J5759_06100 [Bacteroidales bacterium]|nr:hypothetical protein [Bacteroidales bacterium]
MNRRYYTPPRCEYGSSIVVEALLNGSDLTDGGAGDFIENGDEFVF